MTRIAIVGMSCRYPDATSPRELWENVVVGRRAFRRLPDVRMNLDDYWAADPTTPDKFYATNAAVIEGYEFDRVAYKIAGSTYRSTDLTHWLALDVAALALADAGFPMGDGLPRERTGVVVGNSLTGEFSRANQMRLRWPFVRRMVGAALKEQGWDDDQLGQFLNEFEQTYKEPFPAIDEDTLAGSLSNTIAGRICNHFDLKGGGYTVDGACSSSLLSVATACKALVDGDVDVAIAGGVDLSIDPFEIVGFAKTGALAKNEMRVYDRGSNGFWPGEGCGMVVLMREDEAWASGHRIYATVAGWGISSDGRGGMTRPEVNGYRLALSRAYERAGFGIETVSLFEGHGTGTQVGDATELKALSLARRAADPSAPPAAISTIKGTMGHTKAAAGVAGLIKAAMAVHQGVLPPAVGCVDPHAELTADDAALRVLRKAEPWPDGAPLRAGVTAMGFGGINTHVVLENATARRRPQFDSRTAALASSLQDAELLLVDAASASDLRIRLTQLAEFVPNLAYAQLTDLAATLQRELLDRPYRAGVVVTSPEDATRKLTRLIAAVDEQVTSLIDADGRVFLGRAAGPARLGYLFPGQGSGKGTSGGALRRRFSEVDEVYVRAALPTGGDTVATAVAQPRIVTGSTAALRALTALGLDARLAVGHSLGEITALHWAGVMDEDTLLRVATVRGTTMAEHSSSGIMASIAAPPDAVEHLLVDLPVVIAGFNGPRQTVVAGSVEAIQQVTMRARDAGLDWTRLSVSHAFHSPLVAPAAGAFGERLADERFGPLQHRIFSTVSGDVLARDTDVRALLRRQITDPVLFAQAIEKAATEVDLFVEVGPGRVLTGLTRQVTDVPVVAVDTDSESLISLLSVAGAAYVVGAPLSHGALFQGRLVRPLQVGAVFKFFASPCEEAPQLDEGVELASAVQAVVAVDPVEAHVAPAGEDTIDLLRRLAAERAELPPELVKDDSRLLDELHLSSITVGQLVNQAARELGLSAAQTPTNFATATVRELADALDALGETAIGADSAVGPAAVGAAPWARPFALELIERPLPARPVVEPNGVWQVYADGDHPLAEPLRHALQHGGVGAGVLVCLPADCTETHLAEALKGAQAAVSGTAGGRFVLVQNGRGAAGLAKTVHLEAPAIRTTIIHAPQVDQAVEHILAEVARTEQFAEVYYDADWVRREPTLQVMPVRPTAPTQPLDKQDVLLVTGGGKGITAECALAVAVDTGARLAVLGRSDPADDAELASNLARMAAAGITVHYGRADVTDAAQVRAAVSAAETELGPVTAVLHGAGRNEPASLGSLTMEAFRSTFAPKIDGLRAVLDAVDPGRLRLLVTFGSIIGRAGLRGEGHYATANEWLADLTLEFAEKYPQCRSVCLEWSVWSGVGMGERLSVVESLIRDGITPISPDQGVAIMRRLLGDLRTPPVVVITSRTEGIGTIRRDLPDLPLLRFVERPLIRYHGVELITDVELSAVSDPYLDDHALDGNLLFPAVFGMEAMAQVASAALGVRDVPVIDNAEFSRPVVVPPGGATPIRIAATVTDDATVQVAIRSSETAYAVDHFRATLRFSGEAAPTGAPELSDSGLPPVRLDPMRDLYGPILFQGNRFQRLLGYRRGAARHVDVDVATRADAPWFSTFLPGDLLLGDPGMRDALMHGNQVCVPDATLLPAGVERIYPAGRRLVAESEVTYSASERERNGDTYVYDIAVRTADGTVVERWEGLRLQAVRKLDGRGPWAAPLLGPYLERNLGDRLDTPVAVAVEPDSGLERRTHTALALGRAVGRPVQVQYRQDGRPEVIGGPAVSAAHGAGVTLAVAGPGSVACDVEVVRSRTDRDRSGLMGPHVPLAEFIASERGEHLDVAATRVWCATECLTKAGAQPDSPLTLVPQDAVDGWAVLASGTTRIATMVTTLRDVPEPVVFAVLAGPAE